VRIRKEETGKTGKNWRKQKNELENNDKTRQKTERKVKI
jgi:hypothetical protein